MFNKKCNCLIGIIISILLGIVVGYLYYLGLIIEIITGLWIALASAGIGLILLFLLVVFDKREIEKCICINGECLGIGIFGTLILSTIALSIPLSIFNAGIAILIGAIVAFLVISTISMSKLLCCLINSKCKCRE